MVRSTSLLPVCLGLLWSVAFGSAELPLGDEVALLDEGTDFAGAGLVEPEFSYSRIPGLVMTSHSRIVKNVQNSDQCQAECNRQPLCKSYSFDPGNKGCLWSSDNLKYDPDFVLSLKPKEGDGEYDELPGMTYHNKGWMRTSGVTKEACQQMCDKGASCAAFAYRKRDTLCMVTAKSIGFDMHYDFYEKNGVAASQSGYPIKPTDESHLKLPSLTVPNALLQQQKAKLEEEKTEVAATRTEAARIKQQSELQKQSLASKTREEGLLKERLAQVKQWAHSELAHQDEEGKIKLKSAEVGGKADAIKQQNAEASTTAAKNRDAQSAAARLVTDTKLAAASQKASIKLQEDELEEEKKKAEDTITQANDAKDQAEKKLEDEKEEVKKLKEDSDKKDQVYQTKLEAEKSATIAKEQTLQESEVKEVQRAQDDKKEAVAEAKRKVVAQMEGRAQIELTDVAESQQKAEAKESNQKQIELSKNSDRAAEITELKDEVEKKRAYTLDLEKQIAQAKTDQLVEVAKAEVEKERIQNQADNAIEMVKLNAQKAEHAAQMQIEESKRQSAERIRKTERAQAIQLAASKEGANKYKINNAPDAKVVQAAEEGLSNVKEVSAKASRLPEADGEAMLEQAKKTFRDNVKSAEAASEGATTTKYSKQAAASEFHSVESPAELIELGEGPTELDNIIADKTAKTLWPLDSPAGELIRPEGVTQHQLELAESVATSVRGYMSAENGAKVKISYVKFPVTKLEEGEKLASVQLSLNKVSGDESPAIVSVTGCEYDKDTVNFENRPATLGVLTSDQKFEGTNGIMSIELDPALLKAEVANGKICLAISGGPPNAPVLYDQPNIKLNIEKPPLVANTTPIAMKTNIVMDRRRRSKLTLEKPAVEGVAVLVAQAKDMEKEIEARERKSLEEAGKIEMPSAIEAERERVTAELTIRHKTVTDMKIKLIEADPVLADSIYAEEDEKQTKALESEIEAQLPARLEQAKEELSVKLDANLKERITNKIKQASEAKMAVSLPEEIAKSITEFKHQKLEQFEKTPIEPQKMAAGIKNELDSFIANLDLSKKAEKFATNKVKKTANAQLGSQVATQLPAKLAAAAKSAASGMVAAELKKKKDKIIELKYEVLLNTEVDKGGDNEKLYTGTNSKSQAAQAKLMNKARAEVPATFDADNTVAVTRQLEDEQSVELRPEILKKLRKEIYATNLAAAMASKPMYEQTYTTRQKPVAIAKQKAALEANFQHKQQKAEVDEAEKDSSLMSSAEKEEVERATKKSLMQIENAKVAAKVALEYNTELASQDFKDSVTAQMVALPAQVVAGTRNELKASFKAFAKAAAESKISAQRRILTDELRARTDRTFKSKLKHATTLTEIMKVVGPAEKIRIEDKLKLRVAQEMGTALTSAGLKENMANDIKAEYSEGTHKAALAFVAVTYKDKFKKKLQESAKLSAARDAEAEAIPLVDKEKTRRHLRYVKEFEESGDEKLQESIDLAVEGIKSEADRERISNDLTKKSEESDVRKATEKVASELPALQKQTYNGLYNKYLFVANQGLLQRLLTMTDAKAKEISDKAIKKKIDKEVNRIDDDEKPAPVVDPNAPTPESIENQMVNAVTARAPPAEEERQAAATLAPTVPAPEKEAKDGEADPKPDAKEVEPAEVKKAMNEAAAAKEAEDAQAAKDAPQEAAKMQAVQKEVAKEAEAEVQAEAAAEAAPAAAEAAEAAPAAAEAAPAAKEAAAEAAPAAKEAAPAAAEAAPAAAEAAPAAAEAAPAAAEAAPAAKAAPAAGKGE